MKSIFIVWATILFLSLLSSCAYIEGRKYNQPPPPPKNTATTKTKGHAIPAPQGPSQPAAQTQTNKANQNAGQMISPITH